MYVEGFVVVIDVFLVIEDWVGIVDFDCDCCGEEYW